MNGDAGGRCGVVTEVSAGVLSDEVELVSTWTGCPLCCAETVPLGQSGGSVQLKDIASGEGSTLIEVVENGRMDGNEFLKTSH